MASEVVYKRVPIDSLHEDPANARKHGPENIADIRASLKEFGQVEPLVTHTSGKVIGGNGRLKVMRELGYTEVDVAEVDVSDMKAAALGIALNRAGERAEWDKDALDKLLKEVEATEPDFAQALDELAEAELTQIQFELTEPPESVEENIAELESIKQQRKEGNENVIEKTDTEKYLIVVFPTREAKNQQLQRLGLPHDERYVAASAVRITAVGKIQPLTHEEREIKSAPADKAGATG